MRPEDRPDTSPGSFPDHREEGLIGWLRLHRAVLGRPELAEELLRRFGSPRMILERPRAELAQVPGMTAGVLGALRRHRSPGEVGSHEAGAAEDLALARREGYSILLRGDPRWPANLRGRSGMPLLLFARGEITPGDSRAVGVVGSRRASPYGLRQAWRFSKAMAEMGVAVVSGLARGIDAAAHRGALAGGGRTLAVLGSGLGRIYPREHHDLAAEVSRRGAIVTEFPWASPPRRHHFPYRNRLLSALSLGVLVVEAGEQSGSLITAGWAAEQDREVFALPGRVDQPEARGCLRLLQEGARLVIEPEEVLEWLGLAPARARAVPAAAPRGKTGEGGPPALPEPLRLLFEEEDAWHADRIVERLGRAPQDVLAELARLEDAGLLARLPGGAYGLPPR